MNFFKKLFINEDPEEEDKKVETSEEEEVTKFPKKEIEDKKEKKVIVETPKVEPKIEPEIKIPLVKFNPNEVSSKEVQVFIEKFMELYQTNFDKLNQQGFDFYEYYQSVIHGGIDNPQIYSMALAMGKAMDKTLTKDKLLTFADHYAAEINKIYTVYVESGNSKLTDLTTQKDVENKSLLNELNLLKEQVAALNKQISEKEALLINIDGKYEPLIKEVSDKLIANDFVKNKFIGSIETVKNGIINNLT